MTIQDYLTKHGAQKTARDLFDRCISSHLGVGLSDLSDTTYVCDIVEDIKQALEDGDIDRAKAVAKENATLEFAEENEFGY